MTSIFTLLILLSILQCYTLNIKQDYTFYFNTYHYEIDNTNTPSHALLFNKNNIKIEYINNTFIINNKIKLNWQLDTNWNEISYIYNNKIINTQSSYKYNTSTIRRLFGDFDYTAWNKWDHTTEHHVKSGRFRGEKGYKRKYEDAIAMCNEFYATLASIRDPAENEQVQKLCQQLGGGSCWIGLQAKKKNWQSTNKWLDGHPLAYKNWAPGEPNNAGGNEGCAEIYKNGQWNDLPCNRKRNAICEKVTQHYIGDFVAVFKKAGWYKANLYCKMKFGSELATIRSPWQNTDVYKACRSVGNNFDKASNCWIGFKRMMGIMWKWSRDNAIVQYENWAVHYPQNNPDKKCSYINIQTSSGVWENADCSPKKWFVCNSKEQTPQMAMRDMLFPPSAQEQSERYSLLRREQQREIEEKKTERRFARMEQHGYKQKIHQTGEDRDEFRQDKIKAQYGSSGGGGYISSPRHSIYRQKMHMIKNGQDRAEMRHDQMRSGQSNQYQTMQQRLNRLENKINILNEKHTMGSGSMHKMSQGMTSGSGLMQKLLGSISGQPGQGNKNNMANKNYFDHSVNTNGYNPHKDPYFGQMNMKSMGQSMGKSRPGHGVNVYGHMGGRFHPPTGNKNDPYGFNGNNGNNVQYNPQFFPGTQLPGPWASAAHINEERRRLMDIKEIQKCMFGGRYEFCVMINNGKMVLDVIMSDMKVEKGGKGIYESAFGNGVNYFEKVEILFEFNPYKNKHKLCHGDNEIGVCLEKDMENIVLFMDNVLDDKIDMKRFDFGKDNEWNEIYGNVNKKCVYLLNTKMCVMPIVDMMDYMVEIMVLNQ